MSRKSDTGRGARRRSSANEAPPLPFVAIMHGRWPVQISPVTAAGWRWFGLRTALFVAAVLGLVLGAEPLGLGDPDRSPGFVVIILAMSLGFVAYLIPAMLRQARRIDVRERDRG